METEEGEWKIIRYQDWVNEVHTEEEGIDFDLAIKDLMGAGELLEEFA